MSVNLLTPVQRHGVQIAEHIGAITSVAALESGFVAFSHAHGLDVRTQPVWAAVALLAAVFLAGALSYRVAAHWLKAFRRKSATTAPAPPPSRTTRVRAPMPGLLVGGVVLLVGVALAQCAPRPARRDGGDAQGRGLFETLAWGNAGHDTHDLMQAVENGLWMAWEFINPDLTQAGTSQYWPPRNAAAVRSIAIRPATRTEACRRKAFTGIIMRKRLLDLLHQNCEDEIRRADPAPVAPGKPGLMLKGPGAKGTMQVVIDKVTREAGRVVSLELVAVKGELPLFEAGAHIDVHVATGIVRQYSLCGDPADCSRYKIAVLLEAASRGGSQTIHDAFQSGARCGSRRRATTSG